jgi:hypothetical protein
MLRVQLVVIFLKLVKVYNLVVLLVALFQVFIPAEAQEQIHLSRQSICIGSLSAASHMLLGDSFLVWASVGRQARQYRRDQEA